MGKKRLINKLAKLAGFIFVVSILVFIIQIPNENKQIEIHKEKLRTHISNLTQKHQKYLTETAAKIKSVPVDPKIIGEVQSKILKESQQIKLYIWMTDDNEKFVFGSPVVAFARMNKMYDKYKKNIQNDGHFLNQFDYLSNLISHHNKIDFSEFESNSIFRDQKYKWRSYREGGIYSHRYVQPYRFLLSALVTDDAGEVIGELYLKIDDYKNHELYFRGVNNGLMGTLNPVFGVIIFFSGLFLWFLLPTWVFTDAQQRDARSPGLWAFLTLISLFFGLTIYLITRPSSYKSLHCPQCENELNGTKAFCPHCGFDLAGTFCQQCQYPIKQSWQFCPNCRAGIGESKKMEEGAADKSDV